VRLARLELPARAGALPNLEVTSVTQVSGRGPAKPPSISLTMAGESQASFSASVRKKIRDTYEYRCVICLTRIETTQCAHLLDAATQGELQVRSEVMV